MYHGGILGACRAPAMTVEFRFVDPTLSFPSICASGSPLHRDFGVQLQSPN